MAARTRYLVLVLAVFCTLQAAADDTKNNDTPTTSTTKKITRFVKKHRESLAISLIPAAIVFWRSFRRTAPQALADANSLTKSYQNAHFLWQLWGQYSPLSSLSEAHTVTRMQASPTDIKRFIAVDALKSAFATGKSSLMAYGMFQETVGKIRAQRRAEKAAYEAAPAA